MSEDKKYKFKGVIERCVYNSPDFKIYAVITDKKQYPELKQNKYDNVSILGELSDLTLGVEYEFTAVEQESKYGTSYKVLNVRRDLPTTVEETYIFLSEILTENQAKVLVENYPNIIQMVKDNDLTNIDLSKLKGIGLRTFDIIKDKIITNYCLMELVVEFKNILSMNMIKRIYDEYSSIDVLKKKLKDKPYTTLTRISRVGFKTADSIILQLQKENIIDFGYDIKTSPDRCLACIMYILEENENEGHTKMNLANLRQQCLKTVPSCAHHFVDAIKNKSIYYNKENMSVSLIETYNTEKYIASTILSNLYNTRNVWDFDIEKYREVGEFKLSDEQIKILDVTCKNNIAILNGFAGCVDCDTEFFDGTKWKRIADYKDGDKVLQYNKDGTAELVYPERYIKNEADYLWHFETKYGLDQCLSDNHNCYYVTSKGNLYHKTFEEVRKDQERNGFHGKFITTFDYSGGGINLSDDEIRLMVATFADGSFYTKENGECPTRSRYHIKKERKKERLINLAISTNSNYRTHDSVEEGYTDFYIDVPFREKHFPIEWYNCNKHQLKVIADEVMFWDGYNQKNNSFSTSNKNDADFIQFVFSSLGRRATISTRSRVGHEYETCGNIYNRKSIEYTVNYTERTLIGLCTDNRTDHTKTKILPYKTLDGYQYCFTVPSHMLVLRRNNKIFITGNSGKTASTQGLIKMLKSNGKSFRLFSPTGRAAKVLHENTNEPASTIHRGLGYTPPSEWNYNSENKLHTDIVIVDEFSMVDIWLFKRLLEAIDFKYTKILLIGDNAQLPSVSCGNLLHDFMEANIIPTVTLNKIFRYSSGGLMKVATDTRCCKPYLSSDMKAKATVFGGNQDYMFIDLASEAIPKNVVALYKKLLDNGSSVEDIQVLTAKNIGDCGAVVLNNMIQRVANPNYGSEVNMKIGDTTYYQGDLILQTVNNYDAIIDTKFAYKEDDIDVGWEDDEPTAFVANGETGIIKEVYNTYVVVDFNGIYVKYYRSDMNMVKLGYAISIHKSQGGGFKKVILCTPQSHIFMLNSNLLYVGLTRMKEKLYHLGSLQSINQAVKKKANLTRHTFMQELLKENQN